ncbi:MAG: hypothetical protein HXY40_11120 [Chloroflexi bacterium]|nr:hypothetical protein [Chloroflexota bacterium]
MVYGTPEGGRTALPDALPEQLAPPVPADGVTLTLYDQGPSLVRERRTLPLKPGLNDVEFSDIAVKIDPTSVSFVSLTDPRDTLLAEHHFRHDANGREALLARALHQVIEITLDDGTRFKGELCSERDPHNPPNRPPFAPAAPDDLILRLVDGQTATIRQMRIRDIRFPESTPRLYTRPTLRCLIDSARDGLQQLELAYQTQGLTWAAHYNVQLAATGRQFDLNGWATLSNNSGTTFRDAQISVVQITERRSPTPPSDDPFAANTFRRSPSRFGDLPRETRFEQAEARDLPRIQHYPLRRPVSLTNGETRQVELLTARAVPAYTYFVYDASPLFENYPPYPLKKQNEGQSSVSEVLGMLEFNVNALGADLPGGLPAGTVRVYQETSSGGALLLASESRLEALPEGEKVRLSLGRASELSGKRTLKEFRPSSRMLLEETYEIRLRSRRADRGVRVHVLERLFRWSDWEILSASHEYTQVDHAAIEFKVDVPARGETVISYIVRYIWPS